MMWSTQAVKMGELTSSDAPDSERVPAAGIGEATGNELDEPHDTHPRGGLISLTEV